MSEISVKKLCEIIGAQYHGDSSIKVDTIYASDEININGKGVVPVYYKKSLDIVETASVENPLVVLTDSHIFSGVIKGSVGAVILHENPRAALVTIMDVLLPAKNVECPVHETAVIESGAVIGEGTVVGPGAVIYAGSQIGKNCVIGPNAVIGYEGFGFLPAGGGEVIKVRQVGGVVIGDNVEIGAGTCVDRGTVGNTVIGDNTKIDNLVQVGHNVKIGIGVIIAAQAGIAGSCVIDDGVMIGGQVGIGDHITIGKHVMIAGKSGVTKSVKPKEIVAGYPAMPRWQWLKSIAVLKKLAGKNQ
ncbi:MAG: UDP-3-O-(3-hydroxymyristoyl)glucosamine N-acyltransferase [Deltaproteobacteria bacterium]|nr:UDP-3-O-(3-hydroxymyristoyl)glucosamine N-acyltransferase [Deltaproteobacteria bacterium]